VDLRFEGGEIMLAVNYMGLAIVTMRNSLTYSRPCLKSLQRQTEQPLLILAVDNASSDGTASWLRAEQKNDPNLRVMTHGEPLSVAAMWNRALEWGWKQGFERAFVVNNDTEFLPETIQCLSMYMDQHEEALGLGMVTCVSVRDRGQLAIGEEGEWNAREHPDYSAYLLTKKAHKRIPFDENCLGGYVEDSVHHVEMHRAGIMAVCIDLPFLHHSAGTLKGADVFERRRIESRAQQNREYFRSKYGCVPGTKDYEWLFEST
jgi:glycosyltransferase involved in cell wall biosynthesis